MLKFRISLRCTEEIRAVTEEEAIAKFWLLKRGTFEDKDLDVVEL